MRAAILSLACALLFCTGCVAVTKQNGSATADAARIRELEERVARLEAQAKPPGFDEELLALEVERAGLVVAYDRTHPAVVRMDQRIESLKAAHAAEDRARREKILRRLENERAAALVTYTPQHPAVQRLDAQISFLRSDAG